MKNIYITTTLPYVNADPHIGFGLEVIRADALARAHRLSGDSVFFTTGTDEHGQKIAEKADAEGKGRQEYVDHFAGQFAKLRDALDLSYDNFIRTTSPAHKEAAQEMWRRCAANGDIYKKKYTGLYCVGDEMFLKDSDLVNGRCPNHPNMDPQEVEEENYFFALSKYQSYLEEYLAKPGVIEPEFRRLEALNFVKAGLEDFSISREVSRMDWGIPVPGDDTQVMYVWFDALTNYISTLGWPEEGGNYQKFWVDGDTLQLAGKDQVRFQSIMWQAMLKSAGLPATDRVDYHGFITSAGQKMSKSLGNVIAPFDLVEKYGTDATRYMLLRHVHPYDDTDITWERMDEWYTANLVNGLGNLASRIMKMAETHLTERSVIDSQVEPGGFNSEIDEILRKAKELNFQEALDLLWHLMDSIDGYIAVHEPFKVVKTNPEQGKEMIILLVKKLRKVQEVLKIFMPKTAEAIIDAITTNTKPENLFPRLPA